VQTHWRVQGLSKAMKIRIFSYWFDLYGFGKTEVYNGFNLFGAKLLKKMQEEGTNLYMKW
jgi:hypothetical protein